MRVCRESGLVTEGRFERPMRLCDTVTETKFLGVMEADGKMGESLE